jgi:pimeloyl-ACP methyl ester carboxylesterase
MFKVSFRKVGVDGFNIFYREAGPRDAPAILLLHGFPSAGHMFRDLIPQLADRFHVIAPDLPGFGQSDMPDRGTFSYTFDNVARVIDRFTEVVGLSHFAIYVFDYGAPTGFRLARWHPKRINALISLKRKRLRGGAERRLETDPGLLGRSVPGQPRRTARLLGA